MDKIVNIEYNGFRLVFFGKEKGLRRKKSGFENLVLISQLGLNVVTAVFLCVAAGIFLDRRFGTSLVLPFLILGVLSGGLSAYKTVKNLIDREKAENEKELKQQIMDWEKRYGTGDGNGRNKRKGW